MVLPFQSRLPGAFFSFSAKNDHPHKEIRIEHLQQLAPERNSRTPQIQTPVIANQKDVMTRIPQMLLQGITLQKLSVIVVARPKSENPDFHSSALSSFARWQIPGTPFPQPCHTLQNHSEKHPPFFRVNSEKPGGR